MAALRVVNPPIRANLGSAPCHRLPAMNAERSALVAALVAALLPWTATAREWLGIAPGISTRADVVARLGRPSTVKRADGHAVLVYRTGIAGNKQAQVALTGDDIVSEVIVTPSNKLTEQAVETAFGRCADRGLTDDLRPAWEYPDAGIRVVFGVRGFVETVTFGVPARTPPPTQAPRAAPGVQAPPPERPPDPSLTREQELCLRGAFPQGLDDAAMAAAREADDEENHWRREARELEKGASALTRKPADLRGLEESHQNVQLIVAQRAMWQRWCSDWMRSRGR
jgi:hypothetical protein